MACSAGNTARRSFWWPNTVARDWRQGNIFGYNNVYPYSSSYSLRWQYGKEELLVAQYRCYGEAARQYLRLQQRLPVFIKLQLRRWPDED
eukprot:scaffold1617_cov116-Skeletonema_menzelii.AAC.2